MKKRFTTLALAMLLACSLAIPAGAATTENSTVTTPSGQIVLELDYMDFYQNQDYYMNLVYEKDYTLHFNVPEEYQELEDARQAEAANVVGELMTGPEGNGIVTYDTKVPTEAHNIATQGTYKYEATATYSDIYTNYYYIGSSWYVVTVNNRNYDTTAMLRVTAYNVYADATMYYTNGTTIHKYTMSGTGATANMKHFYLKFHAPVKADGTIARGS